MPKQYKPLIHYRDRRERCGAKMEDVWTAVIQWAKENGHEYVPSFGVVGMAPT